MKHKNYWEMKPVELASATKALEEPLVVDQSRALSPTEREQWERVKRENVATESDQGFRRISVRLEQGLVDRVTALARKRRISRSRLLAEVLEEALTNQE
jgi:predicted DNA-binding ribbon-helix-helix protein